MLLIMPRKLQRPRSRPPRIRVPNNERALFTVESEKFVGVIKRLSLTGGSAILAKGPIPQGALAEMGLKTVFGKVTAQIQFLHTGADGLPLAQAFRFLDMDDISRERERELPRSRCSVRGSATPKRNQGLSTWLTRV